MYVYMYLGATFSLRHHFELILGLRSGESARSLPVDVGPQRSGLIGILYAWGLCPTVCEVDTLQRKLRTAPYRPHVSTRSGFCLPEILTVPNLNTLKCSYFQFLCSFHVKNAEISTIQKFHTIYGIWITDFCLLVI